MAVDADQISNQGLDKDPVAVYNIQYANDNYLYLKGCQHESTAQYQLHILT